MNAKEAIEKIRSLLFSEQVQPMPNPEPANVSQFAEYKTKDGVVLSIDSVEVGGNVVNGDAPAADGEYMLEDGTKIVVAGGVIAEVEKGEEPNAVAEEMKKMEQKYASQENQLNATKDELKKLKDLYNSQNDTLKQMFSLVEKLASNSVEPPKERVTKHWNPALEAFRAAKY